MPGRYAHITSVNLASEKRYLTRIDGFPREAIDAANLHTNFLELGCISPDYPYLDLLSGDSKKWADLMHYTHTCEAIYIGAQLVSKLPQGLSREKCLAWLMGYTAHVIADMCIHPVVELKVGPYEKNPTEHRRCEMHQDAHIFRRVGTGMPQVSEHIKSTILNCGTPDDPKQLAPDIKGIWAELIRTVYPKVFSDDPPDMDNWHRKCNSILEKLLPTSSRFVGFARHVCDGLGFSYPTPDEIDRAAYINDLRVPSPEGTERRMQYDDIFNLTIERLQQVWLDVTRHALGFGDFIAFRGEEWNLDTGKNELDEGKGPVFWRVV
jgi:hypothetical protein